MKDEINPFILHPQGQITKRGAYVVIANIIQSIELCAEMNKIYKIIGGAKKVKVTKVRLTIVCLFVISFVIVGQSSAVIDKATVAGVWLLDDNAGDIAKDSSGNGNDGVLQQKPKWVKGKFGNALEFSGANGVEINNPDKFEFLTWTYVFWFKAKAGGDYPSMIGRQFANTHGWTFHLHPPGDTFRLRIDTDAAVNQLPVVAKNVRDDEWHFGAAIQDDKKKKLTMYIDGTKDTGGNKAELSYNGNYKNSGGFLKIGLAAVGAANFSNGSIDEVGIFSAILAEEDILNIMKNGLAAATGLLAVSPSGRLTDTWGRIKSE
jgi:hypothetical protein